MTDYKKDIIQIIQMDSEFWCGAFWFITSMLAIMCEG